MSSLLGLVERGLVPDAVVRSGIRSLLGKRLADDVPDDPGQREEAVEAVLRAMARSPVAVAADDANDQHYEVPAAFYREVLGPHMKYSGGYWPEGVDTLAGAEEAMLALTCERADLHDGQRVLELGCGWGSLTLWMAERYPSSHVTAVSNSASQRRFIMERARERGLGNVRVITADMNDFDLPGHSGSDGVGDAHARVDRVVSVEMFEHMRNWEALLRRSAGWLEPGGKLFLHVFCHRRVPYFFEDEGEDDWMARHFFTGGLMPSLDLPARVAARSGSDLDVEAHWAVNGLHYARTARSWLNRLDAARAEVEGLFADVYGPDEASQWIQRWRLFFMACEELFAWRGGDEWLVGHTRLARRSASDPV